MSPNDPYAKLGGGALDQELFKKKQTPLSSTDHSDQTIKSPTPQSPPPAHKQSKKKEPTSILNDVMTSSLHDVHLRVWRDINERPRSKLRGIKNPKAENLKTRRKRSKLRGIRPPEIENTETHNSSLRLTTEESEHIEDLITGLKRKFKIKTSLNEIARLGLLHIVQDFKKHGENSLIYKVKKS